MPSRDHQTKTYPMKTLSTIIFIFLLPLVAFSQKDANGWTILNPANADKIIYVSSSQGNDATGIVYTLPSSDIGSNPQNPGSTIKPFKTVAAAEAKVSSGQAAWILFKTGDTFYEEIHPKPGLSKTKPMVFSYYGTGTTVPLFKVGSGSAIKSCCKGFANLWVIGLSFYAHTRNPADPAYINSEGSSGISFYTGDIYTIENILIEGCTFRFFSNNVVQGAGTIRDFTIRRNIILDNYNEHAHAQGLYAANLKGLVLEENIFDHNGWYKQSVNGDNNKAEGQATIFNHNTYFANVHNVIFHGNSFYRPSSIGTKWTANNGIASSTNLTITNNLYYDYEVAISLGGNEAVPAYRFKNINISDNILSAPGKSQQTNRTLGWGIEANDWDGGIIHNNYLIHQNKDAINNVFAMRIIGQGRDMDITNNIIYNMKHADGIQITAAEISNLNVTGNEITLNLSSGRHYVEIDQVNSALYFENTYSGTSRSDDLFQIGNNKVSYSQWISSTGENSASNITPSYHQPERGVELYVTEVLSLSGMDQFYTELRNLSRLNWKEEYTAPVINEWIKEGFQKTVITNTSSQSNINTLKLYPNPGQDKVSFKSGEPGEIVFISATGIIALKANTAGIETLDISEIPAGFYLIQFRKDSGEFLTGNFIKK